MELKWGNRQKATSIGLDTFSVTSSSGGSMTVSSDFCMLVGSVYSHTKGGLKVSPTTSGGQEEEETPAKLYCSNGTMPKTDVLF
jgi:hypothetical protein